ncbi:MAG TPA: ribonuclease P [Methanocorpusculum sp.]|nr:ribonuclease P [Methanocorpusculum sp.]HJK80459.1 ribonuclease P [Methanocorpusculum sp.]
MAQHKKGPAPRTIALERIEILFDQAYRNRSDPALADRYVALAREIAMRHRMRIPRKFRRAFCPVCHVYIVPGDNFRVRIQHGKVISTCRICGTVIRYPLH